MKRDNMTFAPAPGLALLLAIASALTPSCSLQEGLHGGSSVSQEEPREVFDTVETVYMTALAYPPGYDWRHDPGDGSAECRLLLLEEGVDTALLIREVGAQNQVGADSDMHRIVDGHLYEDWSSDSETIVRCDGEEVLRLEGREMICDIRRHKGAMYYLGAERSNGGYILRKEDQLVARSPNMTPVGELYEDNGELCFTGISTDGNGGNQWNLVRDGNASAISLPSRESYILELRQIRGEPFYIYVNGNEVRLHLDGNDTGLIEAKGVISYEDIGMAYDGGFIHITVNVLVQGKGVALCVWKSNGGKIIYHYGDRWLLGKAIEGDDLRLLVQDREDGSYLVLQEIGEEGCLTALPEGMRPSVGKAMLLHNGELYLALCDEQGNAVLWKDGRIHEMGFNGYIDHITLGHKIVSRRSFSR